MRMSFKCPGVWLPVAFFLSACSNQGLVQQSEKQNETKVTLTNPASENCVRLGGTVFIEKRGDGEEYGVCLFEDARQCGEWALIHGDCPKGGLKVTGYVTLQSIYCVITGGTYQDTGDSDTTDKEQGTCILKHGVVCGASAYFDGKCPEATGD